MSHFSSGQMNQLGDSLEAVGWTAQDITNLGQAGGARLTEIRMSLVQSDIISAIEAGETELWLHEDQRTGWVRGQKILAYLTDTGLLAGCVGVPELEAIRAKGPEFFRRHFAGKSVVGWGGVQGGGVPYVVESDVRVVLDWGPLGGGFSARGPGLRRK